jgi:alpha-L-fucosidase 2
MDAEQSHVTDNMPDRTGKLCIFILCLLSVSITHGKGKRPSSGKVLWYDQPAANWNEALPIGNGFLGAMVFGGITEEHLQINENTLYSGEPSQNYKNVDVTRDFDREMQLLHEGKNAEADETIRKNWLGRLHANYQPLGDLLIKTDHSEKVTNYRRFLDISDAVCGITYQVDGVTFTREMIASHPDSVIIIRYKASRPVLNLLVSLTSLHPTANTAANKNILLLKGQAPGYSSRRTLEQIEGWGDKYKHPELFDKAGKRKFDKQNLYGDEIGGLGTFFEAQVKVILRNGTMDNDGSSISIRNSSEVVFILSAATSFNGYDKSPSREGKDPHLIAGRILEKASSKRYAELKEDHIRDYRHLFDRVSLDLTSLVQSEYTPTDKRIESFTQNKDPGLVELLFHYGRYLMISGSRAGGQPLNLQGIWNDQVIPPWNGGYTININTEMNYWPAEVTSLPECQEPLFRMIREMSVNGAETARLMYHRRGWVAHHNVSIWRETFPNDNSPGASFWNMSPGWLLSHMWEHFLFSGDSVFLKTEAYPLMKGAAMFYADWLVEDGNGFLVTAAGNSPENTFLNSRGEKAQISQGPTMDMTIVRELFSRTMEVARMLNTDAVLARELSDKLNRLAPFKIGKKGQLQEWQTDYAEPEPQHRHISHLYGLHPGNQINPETTPELFNAVKQSLLLRGDEASGWSMGWKINQWARMLDGNHAWKIIGNLFRPVGFGLSQRSGGGLYKNLLDAHAPFQIDGNFGFTAGVAEMLVQSHAGVIHLLPALPDDWPSGKVKGLRTRGGFVIDMEWENHALTKAVIHSTLGGNCRIRTNICCYVKNVPSGKAKGENPNPLFRFIIPQIMGSPEPVRNKDFSYYTIDFQAEKNGTYSIVPD